MKCTCGAQGLEHTSDCPEYIEKAIAEYPKYSKEAKRDTVKYRYDVLYWNFIHAMAEIGHFGAEKHGELNYRNPGLTRDKSPINHMANHLRKYIEHETYEHPEVGSNRKYHLAAIAFNAMMEFYHCDHPNESNKEKL